jgi:hypothetical protein
MPIISRVATLDYRQKREREWGEFEVILEYLFWRNPYCGSVSFYLFCSEIKAQSLSNPIPIVCPGHTRAMCEHACMLCARHQGEMCRESATGVLAELVGA